MSAELVEITPERCPNGHPLGPGRVLIGWLPCQCSWAREFGTVAGGVSMGLSSREGLGCSLWSAVGLAVAEHGVDDVGAAAGQADQGGVVPLAGGSLAVVVGPVVGVAQRGERGEEQRTSGRGCRVGSGSRP
jgi:hypothetical protein